jgi:pimeloyl-ACP methyl ester carboxylesterase
MYFHGWPGARVEGRLGDDAARVSGVRLIAIDRPGMGLSTFQPSRGFVDWPDDVVEVAATLGLDRFAVLGISGGGPYAAACAWKLADRLTSAGIVSSLAPFDVPGAIASMGRRNRLTFQLVQHLSVLRRIVMARAAWSVSRRPERILESGVTAAEDRQYLNRPNVRKFWGKASVRRFAPGAAGLPGRWASTPDRGDFASRRSEHPYTCGMGSRTSTLRSPWGAIWRRVFPDVGPLSILEKLIFISWTACRRSSPPFVPDRAPSEGHRQIGLSDR